MSAIEVNFRKGTRMAEILGNDILSEGTKAIRVRGPWGCAYAYPSLGAWKEIETKDLRTRKYMGIA